jgi:hypothetical protein
MQVAASTSSLTTGCRGAAGRLGTQGVPPGVGDARRGQRLGRKAPAATGDAGHLRGATNIKAPLEAASVSAKARDGEDKLGAYRRRWTVWPCG